jgi:hypothetical protein
MHAAARLGDCALIHTLLSRGCPSSTLAPVVAIGSGHVDAMWYLLSRGIAVSESLAATVAQRNDLRLLQELRVFGCPWDEDCTYSAAATGSLAVLRWAVEQGCPWWDTACLAAAQSAGHVETETWIHSVTGMPVD